MRRGLRFTAVLMVVLVALTGFKSKSRGSRGHGGGGCSSSSSHQSGSSSGSDSGSGGYSDSDDSRSGTGSGGARYRDNNRYGSTPSAGGTASASPAEPEATVVSCVGRGDPTATVQVRNRSRTSGVYVIDMDFDDKTGREVTGGSAKVRVPARETRSVQVPMDDAGLAEGVARCEVVSVS